MKKRLSLVTILTLFFTLLFTSGIPIFAKNASVTGLTANGNATSITVTGTVGSDTAAVMIEVKNPNGLVVAMHSFAVDSENHFEGTINHLTLTAGVIYTVRAADYEGGNWYSTTFTFGNKQPSGTVPGGSSYSSGPIQAPSNNSTRTEIKEDGTKVETVKETKTDGTKVETVTETKKDGSSIVTMSENGTNSKGSNIEITTVVNKDKNGVVIDSTEQTKIQASKTVTATVEITKDAIGSITEASADVTRNGKISASGGITGAITGNVTKQIVEAAGTKDIQINTTILKADGKEAYSVSVKASDLIAGENLYVVADKDGKMVLVNAVKYQVNQSGTVTLDMKEKADYQLLNQFDMNKVNKTIKKTIQLQNDNETIQVGKTKKITLQSGVDMENVKKITYYSTSKKVAAVSPDGKIIAKRSGEVMIKVRVTLKNDISKVIYMTAEIYKK